MQSLINSVLLSLHKDCADRPSSGSLRLEGHPLRRPVCTWMLLRVGVPFRFRFEAKNENEGFEFRQCSTLIRKSLSLGKKLASDTVATVVGSDSDLFGFLLAQCRLRLIGADVKVCLGVYNS